MHPLAIIGLILGGIVLLFLGWCTYLAIGLCVIVDKHVYKPVSELVEDKPHGSFKTRLSGHIIKKLCYMDSVQRDLEPIILDFLKSLEKEQPYLYFYFGIDVLHETVIINISWEQRILAEAEERRLAEEQNNIV